MSKFIARTLSFTVVVGIASLLNYSVIGHLIAVYIAPEDIIAGVYYASVTGVLGMALIACMRLFAMDDEDCIAGPTLACCNFLLVWHLVGPLSIGWAIVGAASTISGASFALALMMVSRVVDRHYANDRGQQPPTGS